MEEESPILRPRDRQSYTRSATSYRPQDGYGRGDFDQYDDPNDDSEEFDQEGFEDFEPADEGVGVLEHDRTMAEVGVIQRDNVGGSHWLIKGLDRWLHGLDLIYQINLTTHLWRFAPIAIAMSIQWDEETYSGWNFLIPYIIVSCLVAWPLLVAEISLGQIVGSPITKLIGSLGTTGTRGIGASILLIHIPWIIVALALSSYSFIFMLKAPDHVANYQGSLTTVPSTTTIEGLGGDYVGQTFLLARRECTAYGYYVPEIQPMLCQSDKERLDISCLNEWDCQLWQGNGRCMSVPWGPSSHQVVSNAQIWYPDLLNDFPHYCSARFLHDVSTNQASTVATRTAKWSDYGSKFGWRLMLGFFLTLLMAVALISPSWTDSIKTIIVNDHTTVRKPKFLSGYGYIALMRIIITTFMFIMLIIVACVARKRFNSNPYLHGTFRGGNESAFPDLSTNEVNSGIPKDWLHSFKRGFDKEALRRPEVWGRAIGLSVMSILNGPGVLSLGSSKIIHANVFEKEETPIRKINVIFISLIYFIFSLVINYFIYFIIFFSFISNSLPIFSQINSLQTIFYDIRNMPYGQLFTALQTLFDNLPQGTLTAAGRNQSDFSQVAVPHNADLVVPNGLVSTMPQGSALGVCFWLSVWLTGASEISRHLEVLVQALFKSNLNWRLGFSRWIYKGIVCSFLLLLSVILWFSVSWSMMITLSHYCFDWLLPFVTLGQAVCLGWTFGIFWRVKHFGKTAFIVQSALFFTGAVLFTLLTSIFWDKGGGPGTKVSPQAFTGRYVGPSGGEKFLRWLGVLLGGILMLLSLIIPSFLTHSHDAYGRKHSYTNKIVILLFGSTDHLRREMGYRACHTAKVFRPTILWTLLVKYIAPLGLILSIAINIVRRDMTYAFNPYRPFYNDQWDIFSRVEVVLNEYKLLDGKAWIIGVNMFFCLLIASLIIAAASLPQRMTLWMVPKDTDPDYFNVRKAPELFAQSDAHSQVPGRFKPVSQTRINTGSSVKKNNLNGPTFADDLSTHSSSTTN